MSSMAKHRRGHSSDGGVRRVALVGTGHGHQLAPDKGEVWCMNDLGCFRYCTMLWDMHDFDWTDEENYAHYSHMSEEISDEEIWKRVKSRAKRFKIIADFCNKNRVPLMSVKKYARVKTSYGYPLRKVIEHFDKPVHQSGDYLNSALSQCMSYAIYRGFTHIDLFGINVEMGTEWIYQRGAVEYWIGLARGMGRVVTISGTTRRPLRIIDKKVYGIGGAQHDPGVEMVVQDPRKAATYVAVMDESAAGIARFHKANRDKIRGPHVKLWKTDKKGVFVKADGEARGVQKGTKRVPQDEATIEITEAQAAYRFSIEEGEAKQQADMAVEEGEDE